MTLTKVKPRRPTTTHRQRLGLHHRHSHMYLKTYWPYLPIMVVTFFGFGTNNWISQQHKTVLGYATDMSIQSLLDDTNTQRTANGEMPLTINYALNQAAQTKANDMAARDYWSHDTPDGQTPWSFMVAAGYNYQTAGENLAYGFTTASDAINAWMNSPDHRANILNTTYHDIGIGIVNIPNYQNSGPQTLIDAMYGSLASESVIAATPTQPVSTSNTPASTQTTPVASTNTTTTQATQPINTQVTTNQPATVSAKSTNTPAVTEPQQQISRIQLVAAGNSTLGIMLVVILGCAAFAFLILRHGLAWRKTFIRGEQFMLHHPSLDIIASILVVASVILTRASGIIR